MEIGRGSTRSHCVENWLWKRLWTCHKSDKRINQYTEYLETGFIKKKYSENTLENKWKRNTVILRVLFKTPKFILWFR